MDQAQQRGLGSVKYACATNVGPASAFVGPAPTGSNSPLKEARKRRRVGPATDLAQGTGAQVGPKSSPRKHRSERA